MDIRNRTRRGMGFRRWSCVALGLAMLTTGCGTTAATFVAGSQSTGMQLREVVAGPLDDVSGQQVDDSYQGASETISSETVEKRRTRVYEELGSQQVSLAEGFIESARDQVPTDDSTQAAMDDLAVWGQLSPDEVAVLPAEYQFFIPTIGCGQLNARTVVIAAAANQTLTACQAQSSEPNSYLKYLMAEVRVTSDHVKSATVQPDQVDAGKFVVMIELTDSGLDEWSKLAEDAVNHQVAILVDNVVVSAPTVQAGAAASSSVAISGGFTRSQAQELVRQIATG